MTEQTLLERTEDIKKRYQPGETRREQTVQAFDKGTMPVTRQRHDLQERVSRTPQTAQGDTISQTYEELATIQAKLMGINERYGKLNVTLKSLLGLGRINYTIFDAAQIGIYRMLGKNDKVTEVRGQVLSRRGKPLEALVTGISEIVNDGYQTARDGAQKCQELLAENVRRQMSLNYALSDTLRSGFFNTSELAQAEAEVAKLEKEIGTFDALIGDYETEIRAAKQASNIPQVESLTKDLGELLNLYQGVLDGRLSADGVVSDVRRKILDSAETVQSIKGAAAASRVNYKATNALVDSMNELAIKYRNAQDHLIPVFIEQARIAVFAQEGLKMKDALIEIADLSEQLMVTNEKLVEHLAAETFELLKTPLYDPVKARAVEERISQYMTRLNQVKTEWAEATQTLSTTVQEPHYVRAK